jgi:hypothetical protein
MDGKQTQIKISPDKITNGLNLRTRHNHLTPYQLNSAPHYSNGLFFEAITNILFSSIRYPFAFNTAFFKISGHQLD